MIPQKVCPQIHSMGKRRIGKIIGTETKNENRYDKIFKPYPQEGKAK